MPFNRSNVNVFKYIRMGTIRNRLQRPTIPIVEDLQKMENLRFDSKIKKMSVFSDFIKILSHLESLKALIDLLKRGVGPPTYSKRF